MKTQDTWDSFYMQIARVTSYMSYDPKTKVGCVIVKDGNIMSFSYNGTPAGTPNIMRDACGDPPDSVLHAEAAAIAKAARSGHSTFGAAMYVTRCPCERCAAFILQAGIRRVVFEDDHSNINGLNLLLAGGVSVLKANFE